MNSSMQTTSGSNAPARAEMRDQIRQTIVDAQQAAFEARVQAREAQATAGGHRIVFDGGIPGAPGAPGIPGISVSTGGGPPEIPPQVEEISIAFFIMVACIVVLFPIARAFGKRIERKGEIATLNPASTEQLRRIEQAVEAMAIEVERISESQRYMAKLQSPGATGATIFGSSQSS